MTKCPGRLLSCWRRLRADVHGATAIEYALIAASIGAAIAATVWNLGTTVQALYANVATAF
jgi:Flp pilus assembly pilin Flp